MMGFCATRFVESLNEKQAKIEAMNMIRNDQRLKNMTGRVRPMIYVEEIKQHYTLTMT